MTCLFYCTCINGVAYVEASLVQVGDNVNTDTVEEVY